ncbi:MAG TPA: cytochrome c oxidase subunit II [Thermodesulfobacteriota bacterium]
MNELMRRLLMLPEQASTIAGPLDRLHYAEFLALNLIALVLGAAGLWFLVRYRRRPGRLATPRFTYPVWLEATFIGGLLAMFLLWFVLGYRQYLGFQVPPGEAVEVYVTAKQWMWKFANAEGPSAVGVMTVPAGRPVKLILTSRDVIHSFYVPDFRIKQDAVPGRYTTVWFEAREPGRHQILCAEYCGTGHSQMPGEVVVLSGRDYDAWLAGERVTGEGDLAAFGQRVAADQGCLGCHTVNGTRGLGPTWRDLYGSTVSLTDGSRVTADEAYLTESMMDPQAKVVAGYPPVMPSYLGILEAPETAALVQFIKSIASEAARAGAPSPTASPGTSGPATSGADGGDR